MIIDSHVHIWTQQPERYPWAPIGDYVPDSEASAEQLLEVMDTNRVDGTVLVQPTPYGWDNRYLLDALQSHPDRFRAVCLVDPFSAGNAQEMTHLVKQYDVSGFRLNWNLHTPEVWETSPEHAAFWDAAGKLDCPLCIQCTPEHFDLLGSTCRKYPNVMVVIDHLGRVSAENGLEAPEFQKLLALAGLPNVHVKISGWYYCSQQVPPFENLYPLAAGIIQTFGARRCMWGSDFPFIQERWNYAGMLETIKTWDFLSTDDLNWLQGKSAHNLWWKGSTTEG
jgi:predicted TIM-barrel fold metal-dependent hydrolase